MDAVVATDTLETIGVIIATCIRGIDEGIVAHRIVGSTIANSEVFIMNAAQVVAYIAVEAAVVAADGDASGASLAINAYKVVATTAA